MRDVDEDNKHCHGVLIFNEKLCYFIHNLMKFICDIRMHSEAIISIYHIKVKQ